LVDTNSHKVFEIKSIGRFGAGVIEGGAKLGYYLGVLNGTDPQHRHWTAGSAEDYTPPPSIIVGIAVIAFIAPPVNGVIIYRLFDLKPFLITAAALGAYGIGTYLAAAEVSVVTIGLIGALV
jgi:hypothetical protein